MYKLISERLQRRAGATAQAFPVRFVRKRRHGLRTAALVALLLLLIFTLFGFFAVPPIAKHYAVTRLSAALDRDVTIADI